MNAKVLVSEAIQLHSNDTIATVRRVLDDAVGNCEVQLGEERRMVELIAAVPFGHKLAVVRMNEGDSVIKYGQVIGLATEDIEVGSHVHTHNVTGARDTGQGVGLATKGRKKSDER